MIRQQFKLTKKYVLNPLRFTILFVLFSGLVAGAVFLLDAVLPNPVFIPQFWLIFGVIATLTYLAFIFSWIGMKKGAEFSVYTTLGAMVIKLLLCMLFALLYLLKIKVDKVIFVIDFISIYFLFSGFEIWALLTNLRHPNKSE